MIENIKIGFIGFGNMAQAIVDGFLKKSLLEPKNIFACAKNIDKLISNTKKRNINHCESITELIEKVDIIILAIKPFLVENLISPYKENLKNKVVISVVAGYNFEKYNNLFLSDTEHISTIPNISISVAEGITIFENKHSLSKENYNYIKNLFCEVGIVEEVSADNMDIAMIVSGCAPAFASMFIEALADSAVMYGLPRDLAYNLSSQMLVGTGKLQLETKEHPAVIKDRICSPKGYTIKGVVGLENNGFRSAIMESVKNIKNNN